MSFRASQTQCPVRNSRELQCIPSIQFWGTVTQTPPDYYLKTWDCTCYLLSLSIRYITSDRWNLSQLWGLFDMRINKVRHVRKSHESCVFTGDACLPTYFICSHMHWQSYALAWWEPRRHAIANGEVSLKLIHVHRLLIASSFIKYIFFAFRPERLLQ